MGYCISQSEVAFNMPTSLRTPAFIALKKELLAKPFSWIDAATVRSCRTLRELMEECRWDLQENVDGDVIGITFVGEKLGDDLQIFSALAPYVRAGSYIEMCGEDGAQWRWVFDGQACAEKAAQASWD